MYKMKLSSLCYLPMLLLLSVAAGCPTEKKDSPHGDTALSSEPDKAPAFTQLKAVDITKAHTIGVLYWSMNIPGQVAMRRGLEAQFETINAQRRAASWPALTLLPFVAGDGEKGIETQVQQMHSLIEKKVDLIIVQPTDIAALSKPLRRANQVGIPVVAYDQHIIGGTLASFITSDNYQAGYLDGEYLAANFERSKTIRLIMVEYPQVSSTVKRVNGFIDALEDAKQPYRIIATYTAVEPKSGALAGSAILRDFPKKGSVDAIFTINDGGGLSVAQALIKAGRTEIFFATVDGDPQSVELIRSSTLIRIDSAQFCGELGAETMRTAYALLWGKKVATHILVPVFPITKETESMYKGWLAPMPKKFKKPWPSKYPIWEGHAKQATEK